MSKYIMLNILKWVILIFTCFLGIAIFGLSAWKLICIYFLTLIFDLLFEECNKEKENMSR